MWFSTLLSCHCTYGTLCWGPSLVAHLPLREKKGKLLSTHPAAASACPLGYSTTGTLPKYLHLPGNEIKRLLSVKEELQNAHWKGRGGGRGISFQPKSLSRSIYRSGNEYSSLTQTKNQFKVLDISLKEKTCSRSVLVSPITF